MTKKTVGFLVYFANGCIGFEREKEDALHCVKNYAGSRFTRVVRRETGFDKFSPPQMEDPNFAVAYDKTRSEVDSIDNIVRDEVSKNNPSSEEVENLLHDTACQNEVICKLVAERDTLLARVKDLEEETGWGKCEKDTDVVSFVKTVMRYAKGLDLDEVLTISAPEQGGDGWKMNVGPYSGYWGSAGSARCIEDCSQVLLKEMEGELIDRLQKLEYALEED